MSHPTEHYTEDYLNIDQVRRLLEAGRATFPDWEETWASESHQLHLAPRQHPPNFSSLFLRIDLTELEISGNMLPDCLWTDRLKQVISAGYPLLHGSATLTVQCFYNEIESRQAIDCGDNVGLLIEQDRRSFFYQANASKAGVDVAYRRRVLHDMIDIVGLPLSITTRNDHFFLTRTGEGSLWISQSGLRDRDPSGFRCEIANFDATTLVDRMGIFLQRYSSKLFSCSWQFRLQTGSLNLPNQSDLLATTIRAEAFPADQYETRLAITAKSIESLDNIRPVLAAGDLIIVHLGSFSGASGAPCQLEAMIDHKGFRVGVVSESEEIDDISAISASLGVALRPHSS